MHALQLDAMNLGTLLPEMPQLLSEMGVRYDPDRLAQVLGRRRVAINLRALRIATTLGGFITALAKVSRSTVLCVLQPLVNLSVVAAGCRVQVLGYLAVPMQLSRSGIPQDYATGAFESNMDRRAEELQGILARLGPSFAKASSILLTLLHA